MSFEQIKREVALLDQQQQADLISYTLPLRYAHDADYHIEVTDRLNDAEKFHWLSSHEFERRLN